jgi:hypothetical protein
MMTDIVKSARTQIKVDALVVPRSERKSFRQQASLKIKNEKALFVKQINDLVLNQKTVLKNLTKKFPRVVKPKTNKQKINEPVSIEMKSKIVFPIQVASSEKSYIENGRLAVREAKLNEDEIAKAVEEEFKQAIAEYILNKEKQNKIIQKEEDLSTNSQTNSD